MLGVLKRAPRVVYAFDHDRAVFAREVEKRTRQDARILALENEIGQSQGADKVRLRTSLNDLYLAVRSEKLGEVADEFDAVHSVHRAQRVGSVQQIIPPSSLRPRLIEALERGIKKELERIGAPTPVHAPSD